jgi:hypothetical protein
MLNITSGTLASISPDSGISSTDFITNAPAVRLNGTVTTQDESFLTSGTTLGIWLSGGTFGGGILVGQVPFAGEGTTNWSYSLLSLADGTYTITVSAGIGSFGSDVIARQSLTIDTTFPIPPAVSTIVDDVSPITGLLDVNRVTNDNTPTLTGTAEANTTLKIFDVLDPVPNQIPNETLLGTVIVDSAGSWTFTSPTLADGRHFFHLQTVDAAGNEASVYEQFDVDTVAPPAPSTPDLSASPDTGASDTDDLTGMIEVELRGTTTDDGTTIRIYDAEGKVIGQGIRDPSGHYLANAVLKAGAVNLVTATAIDYAGNESSHSGVLAVTVAERPVISNITVTTDNVLTFSEIQAGFSVSGNATGADGQTITVAIGIRNTEIAVTDFKTATVTNGTWTVTFAVSDFNQPIDDSLSYVAGAFVYGTSGGFPETVFQAFTTVMCFMAGTRIATPGG